MNMPLKAISIITPSLNRADLLEDAIYSVQRQNYQNLEHIIVDGGSTDGSLELVKKYGYIRLFSGHDEGMYDALNKGLTLAGGEIICFLNTDAL